MDRAVAAVQDLQEKFPVPRWTYPSMFEPDSQNFTNETMLDGRTIEVSGSSVDGVNGIYYEANNGWGTSRWRPTLGWFSLDCNPLTGTGHIISHESYPGGRVEWNISSHLTTDGSMDQTLYVLEIPANIVNLSYNDLLLDPDAVHKVGPTAHKNGHWTNVMVTGISNNDDVLSIKYI